ncbi:DUF899 family protein [Ornithinibacillus scapharcae]|uniref:DUF899 family protein n=1 Tax=Ornithinibacillus scapharcae TaxID=1147159 RepID=UPI000225C006|nr:DUF899 family protein [Ornithinibacillus scapharcae]
MQPNEILEEINALEKEIHEKKTTLMELRKSVPRVNVQNYAFRGPFNKEISLLELFGDKDELIVIQNMGKSCSYCTMWADGFNGVYHHIVKKAAFVVASPDSPEVQDAYAAERRWQFPMVSTMDNTFKEDMGFVKDGYQYPGVSTFQKDDEGNIYHVADAPFGPGDEFCSVWYLFDLLPSGRKGYQPAREINRNASFELTNNIAIQVSDYEKAKHFYTTILGMEKVWENKAESKLTIGGQNLYIEDNDANKVFFEFAIQDMMQAKSILLQHGCQIIREYSDKSIMLSDPYGLHFHLFERV